LARPPKEKIVRHADRVSESRRHCRRKTRALNRCTSRSVPTRAHPRGRAPRGLRDEA